MENKSVMICLERLDIGGVETAVFNQAIVLHRLGYKVVILAKNGIYTKKLEDKGIVCIDFSFELENNFNMEKMTKIAEIISEYHINEVHIEQFPCILSVVPACIISKVPYVAYSHAGTEEVFEWYMNTFNLYEDVFKFFFQNAYKVVTITEASKKNLIDLFKLNEKQIVVNKNSIDFFELEEIKLKPVNSIQNMLIVSRISKEKVTSIKNAIELFFEYSSKVGNTKLTIIGDGECRCEIEEYIRNYNTNQCEVNMIGAKNNVMEYINDNDVVIGMGRCILEAISMKKIAIISGYTNLIKIIGQDNIILTSKENFTDRASEPASKEDIVKQLQNLTKEEIENIVNTNYEYIHENFDIEKNIYTIGKKVEIEEQIKSVFALANSIQAKRIQLQLEENIDKQKIEQMKQEEMYDKEKICSLEKELKEVYNSKRWKFTEKISKIFH